MQALVGDHQGLWCPHYVAVPPATGYLVFMPDFLAMLRAAADSVLGTGHSYGQTEDVVVTSDQNGTKALRKDLMRDQYSPADPNVQYPHQAVPQLRSMPALEPTFAKQKPSERLRDAARRVIEKNREVDAEVERFKNRDDGYDPDLI